MECRCTQKHVCPPYSATGTTSNLGKVLISVLSTILIALGGYSADTITTLATRVSQLETQIAYFQEGKERIDLLNLRVDGVVLQISQHAEREEAGLNKLNKLLEERHLEESP